MSRADQILNDLAKQIMEKEGIEDGEVILTEVLTDGDNYTSTIHLITIKCEGRENLELFAKVAGLDERLRNAIQPQRLFNTETFVYEQLAVIYDNLQTDHSIPPNERYTFAKYYASNLNDMEESIVLENLVAQDFKLYNRYESMNWEYSKAAVKEMAKLHALSYVFAGEQLEKFQETVSFMEFRYCEPAAYITSHFDQNKATALGLLTGEAKEKLEVFLADYPGLSIYTKFFKWSRFPVLVHGDYKTSNLMYREKDNQIEKLIPVDYQMMLPVPQVIDLYYLIFNSTNGDYRKNHLDNLLDFYYDYFTEFLARFGIDNSLVYPRDVYEMELKEHLPFGLLVGVILQPFILGERDKVPRQPGEIGFANFGVRENELYKSRLLELVEEFIGYRVL